jgi:CBS domain-containing protein
MAHENCGCLLVVNEVGRLAGLITDRDLVLTLASQSEATLSVGLAMTAAVETCQADDSVERALERLSALGVRRLAVVSSAGNPVGLLSIDDLVLHAGAPALPVQAVFDAFREICRAEVGAAFQ